MLDNCEHVIDATAQLVDDVLRVCADVKVLATSRELLGVIGEATWRVGSLSVLAVTEQGRAGGLSQAVLGTESGRLFADRAMLVVPSFAITDRNAMAIAQVCRRLDGIPLAIELAAARLTTLSVDQVAARLDQRFRLLTGGSRTAVRRQQTLEATIDWSYELLSESERTLARRLAVFAGGWSLEAAEAVGVDRVGEEDVLELLSRLVAKSMVVAEEADEIDAQAVRYRYLETIRQYGEQKLLEAGEAERVRSRHRDWYLRLAEEAVDGLEGADQMAWWARLEMEHDNLRAALSWTTSSADDAQPMLRLAGSLGRFWQWSGYTREGIAGLDMALARSDGPPSAERARALNWRGQLEMINGNAVAGLPFLEQSVMEARAVGAGRVLSMALRHLARLARSPAEQRRALLEEALAVSRRGGWKREIGWNLAALGDYLVRDGDLEGAEPLLEESIAVGRESGDLTGVLQAMHWLGTLFGMRGEIARARRLLEDAARLVRDSDARFMAAVVLIGLGDMAWSEGDTNAAERAYREALDVARNGVLRAQMGAALKRYSALCLTRGDYHRGSAPPERLLSRELLAG